MQTNDEHKHQSDGKVLVYSEEPISQPYHRCCTESNKDIFQKQEDELVPSMKDQSNRTDEITDY